MTTNQDWTREEITRLLEGLSAMLEAGDAIDADDRRTAIEFLQMLLTRHEK